MFITLAPPTSHAPMWALAHVAVLLLWRHVGYREGGGDDGGGLRRNLFYVPDLFRSLNLVWVCVGPDLNCINIWNWERHGRWNIVPQRFTIDSLNRYWAEVKIFRSLWKIFPVFVPTPRCFVVTDSVSPWLESPSIIHPSSREMALVGLMSSKYGKKNWHSWLRVLCYCLGNIFITSPCSKTENLQNSQNLSRIPPIWF